MHIAEQLRFTWNPRRHPPARRPSGRRAFSLIELMVVIGIIGILIAIILPALGGARGASRRTVSLGNLRSLTQILELYTQRYDDTYPWGQSGINWCGIPMWFDPIWELNRQWPILLYDELETVELRAISLAPGAQREAVSGIDPCGHPPSYWYSRSFLARPETWSGSAVADPSLLRAVRVSWVSFPSQKVLLWEWEMPYLNRLPRMSGVDIDEAVPMAFADGHAALMAPSLATAPVPNPFPGGGDPLRRLHNTRNGVRGHDY